MDNHQMPFPLNTPLPFYGVDNNCFKLGENVYEAVEDPDDGYRSYFGSVEVRQDSQIFFRTPLDTVVVEAVKRGDLFEGYAVVSTEDKHVWLEFGTEAFDTYYPGFVFNYTPRPPAEHSKADGAALKDARQLSTAANFAFPGHKTDCSSCPQHLMYGGLFCCKAVSGPPPAEWVEFIKRKQANVAEILKAGVKRLEDITAAQCGTQPSPETVLVEWWCGNAVGPPRWWGTERFESEECGTFFHKEVDADDWAARDEEPITATCPRCGSSLDSTYDHAELLNQQVTP